jgi:AraC family transcriptional regulator
MLVDGNYIESVAGRQFDYRPFEVGFHPARLPHRDAIGVEGGTFLCLEIASGPISEAGVRLRSDPALLPGDISLQLLRVYRAFAAGTLSPLQLESAAWELCGDASDERPTRELSIPRWLRRCLEIVEDEHATALTVESMARQAGVHPVHAAREFRRRFGETMGEYVNKVRIRAACAAIRRTTKPFAAIALDAGFADQPHFNRVFKAVVGCTPSAFVAAVGRSPAARSRSQRVMSEATSAL